MIKKSDAFYITVLFSHLRNLVNLYTHLLKSTKTRRSYLLLYFTLRKKTVISSNFLQWEFCGSTLFLKSLERIARKSAEAVHFHKTYLVP